MFVGKQLNYRLGGLTQESGEKEKTLWESPSGGAGGKEKKKGKLNPRVESILIS